MQTPRYLHRREAADYLLTKHGLEVSAEHLARLAAAGGGPASECWPVDPQELSTLSPTSTVG